MSLHIVYMYTLQISLQADSMGILEVSRTGQPFTSTPVESSESENMSVHSSNIVSDAFSFSSSVSSEKYISQSEKGISESFERSVNSSVESNSNHSKNPTFSKKRKSGSFETVNRSVESNSNHSKNPACSKKRKSDSSETLNRSVESNSNHLEDPAFIKKSKSEDLIQTRFNTGGEPAGKYPNQHNGTKSTNSNSGKQDDIIVIPEAHNGINVQGLNERSLSVLEGGADPTGVKSNVNESGASMSNNEIPEAHNGINVQGLNDRSLSVMEGGADPTGVKSNVNKSGASMSNTEIPSTQWYKRAGIK